MHSGTSPTKKDVKPRFSASGTDDSFSKYLRIDGFGYVVHPPEDPKVAFGSSLERECLPRKGPSLSPFMRRIQGEIREFPGPFEHFFSKGLEKKLASTFGHQAFVSKGPRLPELEKPWVPPLGTYDAEPARTFEPEFKPFGSALPRKMYELSDIPGPATYAIHEKLPKQKKINAFGSCNFCWPAVYMFCTPYNNAVCIKCKKVPKGDYFHNFSKKQDMCRRCMKNEIQQVKGCDVDIFLRQKVYNELREFKRARYCGFFHNHAGTTAAVQLRSRTELHKKIVRENYLYQFVKQ